MQFMHTLRRTRLMKWRSDETTTPMMSNWDRVSGLVLLYHTQFAGNVGVIVLPSYLSWLHLEKVLKSIPLVGNRFCHSSGGTQYN